MSDPSAHKPAPAPSAAAPARAPVEDASGRTVAYLPTGVRETSVLMIERFAPTQVVQGQPFEYEIRATNLSRNALSGLVISDQCASNFKLDHATPTPASATGGLLAWDLGHLDAGASKSIKVTGAATSLQPVRHCLAGQWDMTSCAAIDVVQPALKLAMTATAEGIKCDPVTVKYVVTNSGTGVARNVVINPTLPKGLARADGPRQTPIAIGDLAAGQSREVAMTLAASATGRFEHTATATADGNLKADAAAATVLRAPVLTVTCDGPDKQYIGRDVAYNITVTNTGDGVARDAVLDLSIPAGATLVHATEGGTRTASAIAWNLGNLAPKASKKVAMTVKSTAALDLKTTAAASAFCAKDAGCTAQTSVIGIPAVLLEVVDEHDPIERGNNETYVITVTNQGSAADTNIRIVCELEDSMQFVSADGVTRGRLTDSTVTFEPLSTLAPGAKATWRVVVKAMDAGDVRFKTTMNTGQLSRSVEETEATNFYE